MATNQKTIGGWSQYWDVKPPVSFSCAMYGMITSLETLTNPGGFSPNRTPPDTGNAKALWVYGGQGCSPQGYPTKEGIDALVTATVDNKWAGVDFDNECEMNTTNIIKAMTELKEKGKESSYTFLAGADYVNLGVGAKQIGDIAKSQSCARFVLMCYGNEMWDEPTIKNYVDNAVKKTIELVKDKSKVILALTPLGLDSTNLNLFLDYVIGNDIGGLYIWEFSKLKSEDLAVIVKTLGI